MGLDQFAHFRPPPTSSFQWRKHAALQEYMERLWVEETGNSADSMNCEDLSLGADDIKNLRKAIVSGFKNCRSDGGFFYGHQHQDATIERYKEHDLQFCDEALKAIERGECVTYSCWW